MSIMQDNKIDPQELKKYELRDGTFIPCIGYGTFGADHVLPNEMMEGVKSAIRMGYRQLDCASAYGNQREIGEAISEMIKEGAVKREELHITSKLWNDRHKEREVLVSCAEALRDLQVDYLDLYLVHWPFPNTHRPGCLPGERDPYAKPFIPEEYMVVWRQMEKLVDMGLVKSIGVSNMTVAKLESVWEKMRIKPVVNECELHPHFQQKELLDYMNKKKILAIAHTPLGSPNRPERDREPDDTNVLMDSIICEVAKNHSIHPATVCLKWAIQRGTMPVPFSLSTSHMLSNLKCSMEEPLTETEMDKIDTIGVTCRLIKGSVLLWEGASDWRCLWDMEGKINYEGWTGKI